MAGARAVSRVRIPQESCPYEGRLDLEAEGTSRGELSLAREFGCLRLARLLLDPGRRRLRLLLRLLPGEGPLDRDAADPPTRVEDLESEGSDEREQRELLVGREAGGHVEHLATADRDLELAPVDLLVGLDHDLAVGRLASPLVRRGRVVPFLVIGGLATTEDLGVGEGVARAHDSRHAAQNRRELLLQCLCRDGHWGSSADGIAQNLSSPYHFLADSVKFF